MDFFFTANGRFSAAVETGRQEYGSAEKDPRLFTIVRTDSPEWIAALGELLQNKKRLLAPGLWIAGNVFSTGKLQDAPETEWIVGRRWTSLRTGKVYTDEDLAWEEARNGDTLFLNKSLDANCPGVAMIVTDRERRECAVIRGITLAAAEAAAERTG